MNKLLALTPEEVIGKITPPPAIGDITKCGGGACAINQVLTNAIILIYQIAIILFLFMLLFSALQWIISGGDKEKVAAARGRITSAVIGLAILGLAWVITSVLGNVIGVPLPTK